MIVSLYLQTASALWETIKTKKKNISENSQRPSTEKDFYTGSSFAFDATVALAMALDDAKSAPYSVNLSSYEYKDYRLAYTAGTALKKVQFEGISVSKKEKLI